MTDAVKGEHFLLELMLSNGSYFGSSLPEVFLGKGVLKICRKFTGEKPMLSCFATLLKSNFGMGVLLQICCIFSEHFFVRTPLDGCFCYLSLYISL